MTPRARPRRESLSREAVLLTALSAACTQVPVTAAYTPFSGTVHEVATLPESPEDLEVGDGPNGGSRLAAVTGSALSIWDSDSRPAAWHLTTTYSPARFVALAPSGSPIQLAFATQNAVTLVGNDGTTRALDLPLKDAEVVTGLLVSTGPGAGLIALLERRRGPEMASVRVVFTAFRDGKLSTPADILAFDSAPSRSAIASCGTATRSMVVTGAARIAEVQERVVTRTVMDAIEFDSTAMQWRKAAPLLDVTDQTEFAREVVLAPESLALRCDETTTDLLVRSGAAWRLHSPRAGEWAAPERAVAHAAGYGSRGQTVAFCKGQVGWIDDRLERGPAPLSPTRIPDGASARCSSAPRKCFRGRRSRHCCRVKWETPRGWPLLLSPATVCSRGPGRAGSRRPEATQRT